MATVKAGTKKEETRERIVRAAARAIRKHGYEGVGVADVMKDAGLRRQFCALRIVTRSSGGGDRRCGIVEASAARSRRSRPELIALVDTYLSMGTGAPEQTAPSPRGGAKCRANRRKCAV
jgi:hypothetical protein